MAWSNADADDAVRIRAALLRPRFGRLLDIAIEFGLERLREEWSYVLGDGTIETRHAREPVERILANIEEGFSRASEGN